MFSDGKERVNWEQMGYVVRKKMDLRLRGKEKDLNYLSIWTVYTRQNNLTKCFSGPNFSSIFGQNRGMTRMILEISDLWTTT